MLGAWLCAETIRQIHQVNPGVGVEMLAQDFSGKQDLLDVVFEARPEVFGHNLETVPRIFKRIRPGFRYDRSLAVLNSAHEAGLITKSNLILGMGETREEISEAMQALHDSNTDLLTITQYLRPNAYLHPIDRWVTPQEFDELAEEAREIGFVGVMSGPLVRSSYRRLAGRSRSPSSPGTETGRSRLHSRPRNNQRHLISLTRRIPAAPRGTYSETTPK